MVSFDLENDEMPQISRVDEERVRRQNNQLGDVLGRSSSNSTLADGHPFPKTVVLNLLD